MTLKAEILKTPIRNLKKKVESWRKKLTNIRKLGNIVKNFVKKLKN